MAFSIVGGLLAFTVPLMISGTMRPENSDRVLLVGALFGGLSVFPLLLTFFGTKERAEYATRALPNLIESFTAAIRTQIATRSHSPS
jgi:Na+/melibiose symporter-like transporter